MSKNNIKPNGNSTDFEGLQQSILYAFKKSEQESEERLSKIMESTNQAAGVILQAERQNDEKIDEILSPLPYYKLSKQSKLNYYHQLSSDLISQLR